jgi:acetoin utilization deacetylase AcuC-like enzyme
MGFCFFNNVGVGALWARQQYGLKRIACIDFDVHHGNGTQKFFEGDGDLFYGSTHQGGFYPHTGFPTETGVAGNVINCPLPSGAESDQFREVFATKLIPKLRAFAPFDLLLISAGFDAHAADPLAEVIVFAVRLASKPLLTPLLPSHSTGRVEE